MTEYSYKEPQDSRSVDRCSKGITSEYKSEK
jgi:hypothetical protein